jgi:hypothetical protein
MEKLNVSTGQRLQKTYHNKRELLVPISVTLNTIIKQKKGSKY